MLRRARGNSRIALNDLGDDSAERFDPKGERSHIEQQQILCNFRTARQNMRLHSRSQGNHFIRVELGVGLLAARGELQTYFHNGFWQPMDTLRDKNHLEELWVTGKAPWKTW